MVRPSIISGKPGETHDINAQKCVDGGLYRWVPDSDVDYVEDSEIPLLRAILNELKRWNYEQTWDGGYDYIKMQIPAKTENYELELRVPARMLNITTNSTINLRFNATSNPRIELSRTRSPFSVDGLTRSSAIRKVFITTGEIAADIEIMAMG
jgi:hypothetical protein